MKRKVRSVISGFCFSIFGFGSLVFGCGILPIFFLVPAKIRRRAGVACNRGLWIFFTKMMVSLGMIGVRGNAREKLSRERGAIVIANHPSLIDVVLLVSLLPKTVCVVKGALPKIFGCGKSCAVSTWSTRSRPTFFSKKRKVFCTTATTF